MSYNYVYGEHSHRRYRRTLKSTWITSVTLNRQTGFLKKNLEPFFSNELEDYM